MDWRSHHLQSAAPTRHYCNPLPGPVIVTSNPRDNGRRLSPLLQQLLLLSPLILLKEERADVGEAEADASSNGLRGVPAVEEGVGVGSDRQVQQQLTLREILDLQAVIT